MWLICLCLWMTCTHASLAAEEQTFPPRLSIDLLAGEHLSYTIDFLFFKNLAAGDLTLEATETPDVYRAVLMGRTQGMAAWVTRERTQSYVSLMQRMPDGRLRSLEHESRIIKRKRGKWKDRSKRYQFDYTQKKVVQEKSKEGVYRPGQIYDLPETGEPVDFLTAFYNLRLGVYGPMVSGAHFKVPTFSSKGLSDIIIDVMTPEEQARQKFFPPEGLLVRALIDPEIFETSGGYIYVWFNPSGKPKKGIVEDILGAGDVYATLEEGIDEPTH